jgi:protein SCO1
MSQNIGYLFNLKNACLLFLFAVLCACSKPKPLPFLGVEETVNGKKIKHRIPDFEFLNQDSVLISQQNVAGKIYVADFFFTACPTICPVMKTQMLRVFEKYKNKPDFMLLSHSIDPTHDSPSVLKSYSKRLNIEGNQWQFLTGNRQKIFDIGEKSYMVTAHADSLEAGGLLHSGAFMLIDKNRHVRGMYDGTKATEVDKLLKDIAILMEEG